MNKWYIVALVVVLIAIVWLFVVAYEINQNTGEEVVAQSPQITSTKTISKTNKIVVSEQKKMLERVLSYSWVPQKSIQGLEENIEEEEVEPEVETPAPTPTPSTAPSKTNPTTEQIVYSGGGTLFTESDVIMIAKTMGVECPSVASKTEQACVAWCILNRFDAGYAPTIAGVITAPNQFAYYSGTAVRQDLYDLALDVLTRWEREKNGETDVGRVLPPDYMWYSGDYVAHNYFRNQYRGGTTWDYSLPSPYDT